MIIGPAKPRLRPFFSFYGAKHRAAPQYPAPRQPRIIEPFAGSAAYSTLYHNRRINLYDVDPKISAVWSYLITARRPDVIRLPVKFDHIEDLKCCQEAKWLIGFWLNAAAPQPRNVPSAWARSGLRPNMFWGESRRELIAEQLRYIRHWQIACKSWERVRNTTATWFIDPPYQGPPGRLYKYHDVDYKALGAWCKDRHGQVVVCEQHGADWLPFESFIKIRSTPGGYHQKAKHSSEVLWAA